MTSYAADVLASKAEATQDKVRRKLGHFVRLWGLDWPLARVTGDLVLAYIRTRTAEGVKPITIRDELVALRGVLKLARFRVVYARDLETVFPPHFSAGYKPRTRAPSREEVGKLLAELAPARARHVAFIVATGARWGESLRARREDVADELVHLRGTKTAGSLRDVPVTALTAPLLAVALDGAPRAGLLHASWGKYHRDIRAACKRAGIDPVSPNDLRRAFATWHRQAGVTAEEVSLLLGHATDTLAQTTYGRISGADLGERIRARVPNLYAPSAETALLEANAMSESTGKTSVPGRSRTCDLGFRKAPGVARARQRKNRVVDDADGPRGASSVPVPYWVTEATANLLALLAGVRS